MLQFLRNVPCELFVQIEPLKKDQIEFDKRIEVYTERVKSELKHFLEEMEDEKSHLVDILNIKLNKSEELSNKIDESVIMDDCRDVYRESISNDMAGKQGHYDLHYHIVQDLLKLKCVECKKDIDQVTKELHMTRNKISSLKCTNPSKLRCSIIKARDKLLREKSRTQEYRRQLECPVTIRDHKPLISSAVVVRERKQLHLLERYLQMEQEALFQLVGYVLKRKAELTDKIAFFAASSHDELVAKCNVKEPTRNNDVITNSDNSAANDVNLFSNLSDISMMNFAERCSEIKGKLEVLELELKKQQREKKVSMILQKDHTK